MFEERTIKYTEWALCDNVLHYCSKCKDSTGILEKRNVTGRDGDTHKEYRIRCTACEQKSGVHMSKNLTIFDWEGHQEEPNPSRNKPVHVGRNLKIY